MLKVFQKFVGKKEPDAKPENGEITAQSFGGLGRAKLRQDILKHQGLVNAPSLTPAGIAIKKKLEKKQEQDNNATPLNAEDIYGQQKPAHLSYLGSMGITSVSSDANISQFHSLPISPVMNLEEDSDFLENLHTKKNDPLNLPSLSSEANMTFNTEESFEIPSDSELQSSQKDLPEMVSLSSLDFSVSTDTDPLKSISSTKTKSSQKSDPFSTEGLSHDSDTIEFTLEDFDPKSDSSSNNSVDIPSLELESPAISFNEGEDEVSLDISSLEIASSPEPIILSKGFNNSKNLYGQPLTGADLDFAQGLATSYSENNSSYVIDSLREHLTQHQGQVPQKFWYMLMDCYQADNKQEEFEKSAISFAQIFNTSPPSWFETEASVKHSVMSGKNIMILEPQFKVSHTEKFAAFIKAAKLEKFCRINVSPCKFELSEPEAVIKLLELFRALRKAKVLAVLMGDNNLVNFCKNYINPDMNNKMLKDEYIARESDIWLLYLELLQWKGHREEFEELAVDYAVKFEISPPDWDENGVMRLDKTHKSELEDHSEIEKVINSNNVQPLLEMIEKQFSSSKKPEIDLSLIEAIDFAAAGSISYKIQELWMEPTNQNKKITFIYPNEMVVTLLDMVGVTEFVEILPRKR